MTIKFTGHNLSNCFVINEQYTILEIADFNAQLYFGHKPLPGESVTESLLFGNTEESQLIIQSIDRAIKGKRNSCFEFVSHHSKGKTYVGVWIQYFEGGVLCLYFYDLSLLESGFNSDMLSSSVDIALFENLPVCVEVYDRHGIFVDMNKQGMKDMGIEKKEDMRGACLFDNPNLADDVRERLIAGDSLTFRVDYNFSLLKGYVKSLRSDQGHIELEVYVTVVKDFKGDILKYVLVSREVTDYVLLRNMYESLNNQNSIVLDSVPMGVILYGIDGKILYFNQAASDIFGVDIATTGPKQSNVFNSPILPNNFKQAIRDQQPIHDQFEYNIDYVTELGFNLTDRTGKRIIDCNGRPIFGILGEVESYLFIIEDITDTLRNNYQMIDSRRKVELAMQAADIMLWEFHVETQQFFSENEPLNNYDKTLPIPMRLYIDTIHPDQKGRVVPIIERMTTGEEYTFCFDAHVQLSADGTWQYCTVNGSPCEYDAAGRVTKYIGTRKNNTELHQQKHFYERILNEIPLSILIKDVENDFKYVFCNQESKNMFGMKEDGSSYDILNDEAVERIHRTDVETLTTGKVYKGLEEIVLNDGRKYNTIVQKSIINNLGRRLLLSVRWDQTLQIELKRQANLLNLSLELMGAYTWLYHPELKQVTFGEEFKKIGRDVNEVNTLDKFIEGAHPDDRADFARTLQEVVDGKSPEWNYQFRFDNTGHGDYVWNKAKGVKETTIINEKPFTYVLGMTVSIDDHKRTEKILLHNQEELRQLVLQNELILNNTNSGLAYITSDYVVQWENISKCSTSITFEAYKQGEKCYVSAHNRTEPCENCVLLRAAKTRQVEHISFNLQNDRMVEVFASPVVMPDGSVEGVVIRLDDITEREQMISELRLAKLQAEQSDKLKSAFLANMSHEIRTPLNAIVGFSELLVDASVDEKSEYSSIIKNNNDLLLGLINDILDLSKIESGTIELKYEHFDLSTHLNHLFLSMQQRITNPDLKLIVTNPYSCCRIYLDKVRVTQIITNYVTNSIKYTPSGSIEMGYECTPNGVKIYVKDTGIGITEEKKTKVFHRFAKLDDFAQGTGLGLSICKATAEIMGGTVGFETKENEGSLFWAFLPCEPSFESVEEAQTAESESAKSALPKPSLSQRKTILVAEDLPNNYLLVSKLLRRKFNLVRAMNGKEAIEMVKAGAIDLVFMDMKMPKVDGMYATRTIRTFNSEIPIVALTAHAFEADRDAALAAGCNDYLVKPIDQVRLMSVLRKYGLYM